MKIGSAILLVAVFFGALALFIGSNHEPTIVYYWLSIEEHGGGDNFIELRLSEPLLGGMSQADIDALVREIKQRVTSAQFERTEPNGVEFREAQGISVYEIRAEVLGTLQKRFTLYNFLPRKPT